MKEKQEVIKGMVSRERKHPFEQRLKAVKLHLETVGKDCMRKIGLTPFSPLRKSNSLAHFGP